MLTIGLEGLLLSNGFRPLSSNNVYNTFIFIRIFYRLNRNEAKIPIVLFNEKWTDKMKYK